MQRGRGWASLQTGNGQISGFPTEVDSNWAINHQLTNTWQTESLLTPNLLDSRPVPVRVRPSANLFWQA